MNSKLQRALPVVFSALASVGVAATAYSVAKETKKAQSSIDEAFASKDKKKIFVTFVKSYKWSLAIGTATIASITAGTVISKKIEASLSAAVIMLNRSFVRYKNKAKQILGEKAHEITAELSKDDYEKNKKAIDESNPHNGKQLFCLADSGIFFWATMADVAFALNDSNARIRKPDYKTKCDTKFYASYESFLYDACADITDRTADGTDIDEETFGWGWSADYLMNMYGDDTLTMKLTPVTDENGVVHHTVISFDQEPIACVRDRAMYLYYGMVDRECPTEDDNYPARNLMTADGSGDNNCAVFTPSNPRRFEEGIK